MIVHFEMHFHYFCVVSGAVIIFYFYDLLTKDMK